MAQFKVKLGSGDGSLAIRQIHGTSAAEIRDHFTREGFFVFSVSRIWDWNSLLGFERKIPAKKFILFNREFRSLIKAGLPVVEGLDILLRRMKAGTLRTLVEQVRDQIGKGKSVSEAFASFSGSVPRYYPALLLAGEQAGTLVEVLERFIGQEERQRRARKKFMQTLTYPFILLLVGFASLYIILTKALPQFTSVYAGAHKEIPLPTQIVMRASNFLTSNSLYLIVGLAFVIVGLFALLRNENGALHMERIVRRMPLVGTLWTLQNQNIFSHTMRLLVAGGVPVPQALAITADAVPSRSFGADLSRAHAEILQGKGLQEALDTHTKLGDAAAEMIRIGEATGSLEEMLGYIGEHGEEQADDQLELISNLIAPLVLLAVGLLIAFLVVAMYLPMFGSYDAMMR